MTQPRPRDEKRSDSEKPEAKTVPWFEVAKAAPAFLRDSAIVCVLLYVLLTENAIGTFVCSSGASEVGLFGISAKANCVAKEALQQATHDVQNLTEEQRAEAPVSAAVVQSVVQAQKASPGVVPSAGWLFLGQRKGTTGEWKSGTPKTIQSVELPVKAGTEITIRDDAYLRDDSPTGAHSSAKIISVARAGERYQVISSEESSAVSGDPFVWARVTKLTKE